jgi:protein O-GlcNAc transferase
VAYDAHREELAAARRSLLSDPTQAQVWYLAGACELALKLFAEAAVSLRKALKLKPGWPDAQHQLGRACFALGLVDEAVALLREAAAAGGDPQSSRRSIATYIPGSPAADRKTILEERQAWAGRYLAGRPRHARNAVQGGKLKIGYISAFFADDNWMKPVWGLIGRHDRSRFEIHLFSDAPETAIRYGYDHPSGDSFHDISGMSNEAAVAVIEACGLDVLIDLNGYSAPDRLGVIGARPARVVAGWFNAYATSGMESYDFLIGDSESIPAADEEFYCEKVVRVPGSYLTFDVRYPVPEVAELPSAQGHPFTFGSLSSQHKINPGVIHAWCEILKAVPESRLILRNGVLNSERNCRFVHRSFEREGIEAERVVLLGWCEHFRFLQTYDEVDIALDTFPYNGGTTTTEALWQGVPVVTFWGDRQVSRTSASLLRAAGLGNFVAVSVEEYVSMAVMLATRASQGYLAELRRGMRARLRAAAVCDTETFARDMEGLYCEMASKAPLF